MRQETTTYCPLSAELFLSLGFLLRLLYQLGESRHPLCELKAIVFETSVNISISHFSQQKKNSPSSLTPPSLAPINSPNFTLTNSLFPSLKFNKTSPISGRGNWLNNSVSWFSFLGFHRGAVLRKFRWV